MADTNTNGGNFLIEAARLRERVETHDKDIAGFQQMLASLDRRVGQTYTDLAAKIDSSLAIINAKIEERGKIQWPAIGALLSAIMAIGALAYWPIQTEQGRLAKDIDTVNATLLAQSDRLSASIEKVTDKVVPRGEHVEKWNNFDAQLSALSHRIEINTAVIDKLGDAKVSLETFNAQHADLKASIARDIENVQRQIDDLQRRDADTYSVRDVLLDEKKRVDDLERDFRDLMRSVPLPGK
jgi:chromosome segregation ATPase